MAVRNGASMDDAGEPSSSPVQALLSRLHSEEPFERWLAVQQLLHRPVHRWLAGAGAVATAFAVDELRQHGPELTTCLLDLLHEDGTAVQHASAAVVLAEWTQWAVADNVHGDSSNAHAALHSTQTSVLHHIQPLFIKCFPPSLIKDYDDSVASPFLRAFHDQSCAKEKVTSATPKSTNQEAATTVLRTRILMLRAIAVFADWSDRHDTPFAQYLDALYYTLLDDKVHHFYQTEVLRTLTHCFALTPRNRCRVAAFVPRIEAFSTGDASFQLRPVLLQRAASAFWSVWAPLRSLQSLVVRGAGGIEVHQSGSNSEEVNIKVATTLSKAMLTTSFNSLEDLRSEVTPQSVAEKLLERIRAGDATNFRPQPLFVEKLTPYKKIQRSAVTAVQPVIDAAVMTYATPLTVPADAVAQVSFVNGASGPLVMFNRYPFTREVIIQNKSTSAAVPFRLHVAPHRYFSVHPAFGVLGRGESIAVQVTFQARPYELRDKSDVRGYLRLKRTDGVTIERLSLVGYSAPMISVSCTRLDFGHGRLNQDKTVAFYVQNVATVETAVCITMLVSKSNDYFKISHPQFTLASGERQLIKVTFTPTVTGEWTDTLVISSIGEELLNLTMHSRAGAIITSDQTKLDFGKLQMDMSAAYPASLTRKFSITNHTEEHMPVVLRSSTGEVAVYRATSSSEQAVATQALTLYDRAAAAPLTQILLAPGETLPLVARLTPCTPGDVTASISVIAPNMAPLTIHIHASVAMLYIGTASDIIAPLTFVGAESLVPLPIGWLGSKDVVAKNGTPIKATIQFPRDAPFHVIFPKDAAGAPATPGIDGSWELEVRENLAIVQIAFVPKSFGCFRVPVRVAIGRMTTSVFFNGASYVTTDAMSEQHIDVLRRFLQTPALVPPSVFDVGGKFGTAPKDLPPVFELSAVGPTKLVGGEFDIIARPPPGVKDGVEYVSASAESEPRISTITLRNKKNAPQRYRLFLQGLLEVDTPLDGVILPYEELEICLRLDDRLLRRAIPMSSTDAMFLSAEEALSEVWHFTGVTIMSPNYAVQHINFGAMLEEAMTIDVCRFPLVNPIVESRLPVFEIPAVAGFGKKDMRNVLIRNRSDVEIAWSANVVTFRGPMTSEDVEEPSTPNSLLIGSGSAATAGLPQVFQMVASEGKLKPFASTELSIMVQVTQSGDYVGKLWLNYEDFSPIDNATTGPHRLSEPILLSYSFGMVDLHLSKDMLDMGDVGVSDPNMQALELFNKSTMPARDTMVLCKPPWLLDTCFLSVPSSASARMSLSLRNDKPTTASTLDVAHDLFQHSFPVPGSIGCFSMGSNLLAWPLERMDGPSPVTRLHDFGLVPRHHSKYKPFILSNIGTVTFNINAIRSADHCLACRVPPLHPDAVSDRICNLTDVDYSARMFDEGHLEVDWEEVEHHRLAPHIIVLDVLSKPSAMVHKLQAADRQLPLVMRPGQSALFWLFFGGFEGERTSILEIHTERAGGLVDTFVIPIKATSVPPIELSEPHVDFGIQAVGSKNLTTIRFANRSLKSHSWSIQRRSTKVMMHPKFDHQNVLEYFSADDIEQTLQVLPTEGVLNGHCAQALEISFKPSIPFCETVHHLALVIDGLSEYPITARGYGATTSICCAVDVVQFGAVRVGLEKICTLPLMNNGALPVRYYAESNDSQVTVWPEAGIIDGHGKVQLKVRYMPSRACETHANIWITPFSEEPYILVPVTIPVTGSANYPKIELLTKDVDFGRALLQFDNVRQITVENRGLVDAILKLQSSHPCIRLEPDCVTLLPKSRHEVNIVYNPTAVEKLLSKAIIQSADGRGEKFVIALRGDVGIPKLVLYPLDSLKHLDFGVCKINELTTKTMTLVNEGNIDITFQFIIQRGPAVDKEVFSIEPQTGLLGVGDKCDVKFHFRPKAMKENAVRVTLDYKFGSTKGVIVGTGGKSVVTVDMLQPVMDFGLCRMGRVYTKELVLKNHGNLASTFRLRPEPALGDDASKATDPENGDVVPQWQSDLHGMGVEILNADGYCPSLGVTVIRVAFKPVTDKPISQRFRLFFNDNDYMDFDLLAAGSVPRLELSDNELSLGKHKETRVGGAAAKSGAITVPKKDLGTHPVATEHVTIVYLRNPGMLGIDFLIQPFGMDEFEVSPRRGFIEPGMSIPLKVYFRPLAEFHYQVVLKVLWELEPLVMQLSAHGGVGRLLIEFSEEKDMYSKCFDFGLVPKHVSPEKRFHIYNVGMVDMPIHVNIDATAFTVGKVGDVFTIKQDIPDAMKTRPGTRRAAYQWLRDMTMVLAPRQGIELALRFDANLSDISTGFTGEITFGTSMRTTKVAVCGRSGTFDLTHRGDLNFGDVATNGQYSRKLTVANSGSIPATLKFNWSVVGNLVSEGHGTEHVKLAETSDPLDPRSGWPRQQYMRENKIAADVKLRSKDYWSILKSVICVLQDMNDGNNQLQTSGNGKKVGRNSELQQVAMTKRKQTFYELVLSTPVSNQSSSQFRPYLRVEPPTLLIPPFGSVEFKVDLVLAAEQTFLATLLCHASVAGIAVYEIPLTATPKAVNIVLDDTSALNFGMQPLGESESLFRKFRNNGKKDISWVIAHRNSSLQVIPNKGTLKAGAEVRVEFIFSPLDESVQTDPVYFEPDCSTPVRISFLGGGGFSKISLLRYKRFDFGSCMINRTTESGLPITNEGNATLHLTTFDLDESPVYKRGASWPVSRISLAPGETFMLSIVFHPTVENPPAGRLCVGTKNQSWDIELIGSGREAVLIVSRISMEFVECIVGNEYEQKLSFKNIGDVNYPVEFRTEPELPDITFDPPAVVLKPFGEGHVTVKFKPRQELQGTYDLVVSSPYSVHLIPVTLHSGIVAIDFSAASLDFGMFEKSTKPTMTVMIRNIGSVKTNYHVRTQVKPALFQVTNFKGTLAPRKATEVKVTYSRAEVHQIHDRLTVKTDLVDKIFSLSITGQAEEAAVKLEEFSAVNLGVCPAMETTTKSFKIANYGRFPLSVEAQAAYPIKIHPPTITVNGGEDEDLHVSWFPSGAYELRSIVKLLTNIGPLDVTVRGKALLPELVLRNNTIDFGVCAVGHSYDSKVAIFNKGKVPLHWNLPATRDGFSFAKDHGIVESGASEDLIIRFSPTALGRKMTTFLLECRGLNFKELHLSGVGGTASLEVMPDVLDFGICPCLHQVSNRVLLHNTGSVVLRLHLEQDDQQENTDRAATLRLLMPPPCVLLPRQKRWINSAAITTVEGVAKSTFKIVSKEVTVVVPVQGTGVKIQLTERMKSVLEQESLYALKPMTGLTGAAPVIDTLEASLYRHHYPITPEFDIVTLLDQLRTFPPTELGGNEWEAVIAAKSTKLRTLRLLEFLTERQSLGLGLCREDFLQVLDEFVADKIDICRVETSEDMVAQQVIDYPYIDIKDMDLAPILTPIEFCDNIDLSPILARPVPFERLTMSDSPSRKTASGMHYRSTAIVDPTLSRKERNAHTPAILRGRRVVISRGQE